MDSVLNYIHTKEAQQSVLLLALHRMITDHPKVQAKISYSIPCYRLKNPICHLNPLKNGGVEIVFWRARELSNESGILEFKDRKRMAGISYYSLQEIDADELRQVLQEAYLLDETTEHKPMKLNKR
ncbi:DUF1801 domain-containing protein [Reichenbachiella agarivorans]|uniref:DUF1801 domain-containing protein n=1 Tax=Reichenbachiella agarivorans TaxID=2979464 RepID=A0ABY6CTQ5_9BACT|nr:DUF1801 domain-containing protein [Reichenbachiella agarivorans]UXP33370.1 DUF1801 domain-containing protein [Reichenbachiella agarivorans]